MTDSSPQAHRGLARLWQALGFGGPLSAKQINKSSQLAANPFAQPDVRMREMQRLIKDGQPAALLAVLKRFSVTAQGHIADEEEKRWLQDALGDLGQPAKAALGRFIEQEDRLTHALATYEKLAGAEQATAFFAQVLAAIGPADHRRIEAKRQLLLALAPALDVPAVQQVVARHLLDHADDVAIAALGLVESACQQHAIAEAQQQALLAPLTRLVTDAETSARLALRAAEIWAHVPAPWLRLPPGTGDLAPSLSPAFAIDQGRLVPRVRPGAAGSRPTPQPSA